LFEVIKSIAYFFESGFGFFAPTFEQVDDCQVKIGNISILSVAFVEFFEAIAACLQLSFVKEVSRLRDACCMRGATEP
jgi:hypothetical protein